jgi:type II secretory pathway pseudopilin PulG
MKFNTKCNAQHPAESSSESGFMMVFAVVLVALMLIALAVAAPIVAKDLRRDKEVESAHRANEYVRAIRLYYRKFKTYPPSIEALEGTNNVRFLRKKYVDPLTGKDDWRIIHVGENKTTVKGFFGEPLGGLNTTGAGGLGSASSMQSNLGSSPAAGTATPSNCTVSGGSALTQGFAGATTGCPGSGAAGSSTSSDSLGSGGGQIMGVGTTKTGDSILEPNQQTTYETWEFIYDPKIELLYQKANILGGGAGGTVNSTSLSNLNSGSPNSSTSNTPNTPAPPANPPATNAPF